MTDKEQIKCNYKFQDKEIFDGRPYCTCFCELCEDLPPCDDNCQIYEDYKQLARKTQECEDLKKQLMRKDEINTFFNSPIEGWSSDPCGICKYKDEYSRYRKALEEIEKYCTYMNTFNKCNKTNKGLDIDEVLDIINKAKGE